ncbi:MAG: SRPBCC domain-containing protein [Phycisphaeraceae bacterium]|nr:SRPBCC domain-containing protein [Phycisphaeraceae bacterium]
MFSIHINGPVEAVWREITRTDAPIACFFNSRMDVKSLEPGSKLAMRTPNGKNTGVVGEILEFTPPTRFSHTFRFTNMDDPPCRVTYDLKAAGGGTEFTLTIDDLTPGTKSAKQMVQGAKLINNTLKSVIERGRPGLGTRLLFKMFALFPAPKRCRSEHWPV